MESSCKELSHCMEDTLINEQGSDGLTIILTLFIMLLSFIQSCIEYKFDIND